LKPKRVALYTRVSSDEQNNESQERALRDYVRRRGWSIQKIYRDHGLSGATANRPALNEMLKECRRGSIDVIVVWKFDRFARSLQALISGLELCRSLGIDFVSVTEAIDTSLPAGELVFQMIGAVAQFERSLIGERVRSGLANARAKGKVLGRPPLRKLTPKEICELRRQRRNQHIPFRDLANEFGISVWTTHRLCTRWNLPVPKEELV
jgi:DNA invertase Pin-like site-specific DNA recombinase